jgi:alpha-glucosidase (family GH31 glycosyl hydrolase)
MAQQYFSKANENAIVIQDSARFTILTERFIRLEYQSDKNFTDNASLTFLNRNLPVPEFTAKNDVDTNWLLISTDYLSLYYKKNSGPFTKKNLKIIYKDEKEQFTWYPGLKDKKNLKGTTRTLDLTSGKFVLNKLRKIKLEDGVLSKSGWTLFDDSKKPLFDNSDWPWVEARKNKAQDLYFMGYGKNFKAALKDFTLVAGKMPIPPKYAFGIWYSRWQTYADWELKEIVETYEKYDLPLDVLVVDMDWHITKKSNPDLLKGYPKKLDGWTGYTWEKKYFPDYKEFLQWTNNRGIQTCFNLHPAEGVQPHEIQYADFAKAMNFDTTGKATIKFDITNKKFAENYFKILLHPYEKEGVDFWWLDWQQWSETAIPGVNPTFYLNYLHFTDMERQGKRPLIFHRWGGLGNHRYQIGFSGDAVVNWKSLKYQPEFTATASNVCFGYWSHDIGGFFGLNNKKITDPELYTRWIQWGAFSPIFRTHGVSVDIPFNKNMERRMWMFPKTYFETMKKAVKQRYALLPYIYTHAHLAHESGISLIRPMYYEHPELEIAYEQKQQYYFGENMLVSPITRKTGVQSAKQEVWLPPGEWYNYYSNERMAGNKMLNESFEFQQIPIYIKAGSIIPTQKDKLHISQTILDTLILSVYPDQLGNAKFTLYEDDGITDSYKSGAFLKSEMTYAKTSKKAKIDILPEGTSFDALPETRTYIFQIIGAETPKEIVNTISGEPLIWKYDESAKLITIQISEFTKRAVHLEINF